MIEMKRILCPIDFSEFSTHALECAVAMARRHGSRVTVLHVFTHWPAANVIPSLEAEEDESIALADVSRGRLLRALQGFVDRCPGAHVETLLQEASDIHREILAQAEALDADLIVMGSHGRSGFEHLLLGSITEKVLRKAACPVLVVPRRSGGSPHASPLRFGRILCPVDFSDSSLRALSHAIALAEEAGAELTLLHVVELPPALYESPATFDLDALHRELETDSLKRLRALVADSRRTHGATETIVSAGKPSRSILDVAAARNSDLIVMGVQGRGALDVAVFGSNTHTVIRSAACPVLTVRGTSISGALDGSQGAMSHAT